MYSSKPLSSSLDIPPLGCANVHTFPFFQTFSTLFLKYFFFRLSVNKLQSYFFDLILQKSSKPIKKTLIFGKFLRALKEFSKNHHPIIGN